jgi:glycosyltransferase involved in cell wall biosynthesis
MRVLAITPKVDPNDDLFGFAHTWMSRLAARVERLDVLQLWDAPSALPANARVHTMGKAGGAGKAEQLARFSRVVGRLCLEQRVDAVLAHMGPIFAVCAAPFARAGGQRLALWYAHGAVSPTLRLAHLLVDRVGTSTPAGFRIPSRKVHYTGQGIDADRFRPPALEPTVPLLVSIGRLSPVKDYETILRALVRLRAQRIRPRLEIVGGTHLASERAYLDKLREVTITLGLQEQVSFRVGVAHQAVAPLYQQSTLFLSASRTGSLDKAVLEALACARPVITCNEAFADFFGPSGERYLFRPGDDAALADRLAAELAADPLSRRARGLALRKQVVAEHSVDHLADELVALLG